MQIHVWTLERGLQGKEETLNVNHSSTIEELKTMIQAKMGIPCDEQRLIYGGKLLADHLTLSDYNIREDANIHIVKKIF